jgi:hypothetical protein
MKKMTRFIAIKGSLNKFCKNDFLKAKLNEITLNVNKIIFEAYLFANVHIIRLLRQNKPIPTLNQKFFTNVLQLSSKTYKRKEMECKDKDLLLSYEVYKQNHTSDYQVGYRDYITSILNYIALEMETATQNHLVLNFYKRFFSYIKNKHPTLSKSEVYEICKGLYDKNYQLDNPIVLQYRQILNNIPPDERLSKINPSSILQIYDEILTYNQNNNLRLFSLLPLKQSFNMSYITLDKNGLRDLIVQDALLPGKKGEVRKFVEENPSLVYNQFFNIQRYESDKKKFIFFKTDGVSVSVVLEYQDAKIEHLPTKRKRDDDNEPVVASSDYDLMVGIDPGLRYVFVGKSNENIDKKKSSIRMSSKQYYHDCKFNWKTQKQQRSYKNHQQWMDYSSNMPTSKTNDISELQNYLRHALKGLDMALQLHFINPFRKWKFKTFI